MSETLSSLTVLPLQPENDSLAALNHEVIADETVRGLGAVCLRDVRTSGRGTEEHPYRVHRLYTVELDGHAHAMEVTDPVEEQATFTIVSFPGYTEHIEGGIRQKMHNHLSYAFPNARIVSIASNGIGTTGDRYSLSNREEHTLEAMGEQRQRLVRAVSGETPVIAVATSMGSVICTHMIEINEQVEPEEKIDLRAAIQISPALVDKNFVIRDMGILFLPELALDLCKELLFKTNPKEYVDLFKMVFKINLRLGDVPALLHQVGELLKGTSWDKVENAVLAVPTLVMAGENDVLAQHKLRDQLKQSHPHFANVVVIRGRGHGMAFKPSNLCRKILKAGGDFVHHHLHEETKASA